MLSLLTLKIEWLEWAEEHKGEWIIWGLVGADTEFTMTAFTKLFNDFLQNPTTDGGLDEDTVQLVVKAHQVSN
jgi:hypothetical protein